MRLRDRRHTVEPEIKDMLATGHAAHNLTKINSGVGTPQHQLGVFNSVEQVGFESVQELVEEGDETEVKINMGGVGQNQSLDSNNN